MADHRMSEPEAFRWIQRAAMDNRTSMRAVAQLVLDGETHQNTDGHQDVTGDARSGTDDGVDGSTA